MMFFTVGKFTYISIKMVSQNQEFVASIPENETSELDSLFITKTREICPLPQGYSPAALLWAFFPIHA